MTPVARQDNLLTQDVGGELVVYDQTRHRVHRLNPTAAAIWRQCDGKTTVADMAMVLPENEASEEIVWLALEKLGKAHLLESRVESPAEVRDQSRRSWMRRAAMAGGAVVLLPVVASMTAPTPAMAQSPNGDDDDDDDIEIVAAGAAVGAAALAAGGGGGGGSTGGNSNGDNNQKNDDTIPCASRVPGAGGSGCTGAPCGPGLRCLPSLTDPSKCVCR